MQVYAMGNITPNLTTIYGNEPSSTRFLIFNSFLLILTFLFGTSGNLLVFCAVLKSKSLQTSNNALLLNLSAVALLRCSLDSPVFLVSLIVGDSFGLFTCCLQQFTFSLCSGVQFLTLALISVERFSTITFPFKKRNEKIGIWILFIWVCGLFIAVLSLTMCDNSCYVTCQHLQRSPGSRADPFTVYVLLPVWGLSLILIIIHYFLIFSVVKQHTNKITDTGVQFKPYFGRHLPRWDRVAPSASARLQKPDSSSGNQHAAPRIAGAVCILTPAARELGKKRLEGRVAKRFGYVIITATVFWAPLFIILVLNMCEDCRQNQHWLLCELRTCALVVTNVPATVEPLIYTLLHRQLRSHLHKLLPNSLMNILSDRSN
ncbi:hypothetical protein ABG768_026518 [Culter alburnus]|uniref:G-protein coupled receptors family 1 profile domain-containing protein n=1 Tax=Culter alburnus TaxID=194366 RepID=A0AAW2ADG8_CULAL